MCKIYFDMDGTIANLYGVEDWLSYLLESNPYPYMAAETLCNFSVLAKLIHKLQNMGHEVGIISWLAKNSNNDYDALVTNAKRNWLKKHLPSVTFDEIHIVSYGTPKQIFKTENSFLFDDEERNREAWGEGAFSEKNLLENLKLMLDI